MVSEGNQQLRLRLEPLLWDGLVALSLNRNLTVNELVRIILSQFVKHTAEDSGGVQVILRHLDVLVATLAAQSNKVALGRMATKVPMKAEKDTQSDRLGLHETVNEILKTVIKLCENEEAAKNAKARMEAMRLANTTIRTDLMLLQGFDIRDIQVLLDEVKATNESLKAKLGASEKGPKETGSARG